VANETRRWDGSLLLGVCSVLLNAAAVAKHHGVKAFINMSQMTVSQMSITETTPSPQHKLQGPLSVQEFVRRNAAAFTAAAKAKEA
jgi:hypothetical protein